MKKHANLLALFAVAVLSVGAVTTIRWTDIRSTDRHGNATHGQASDNTGSTNAIPKYDSNGNLTGSGASIDGSNNISTPGNLSTGVGSGVTGSIDLIGATSGSTVTVSVGASTAAGTLTLPGATANIPYNSGSMTAGDCVKVASDGVGIQDAGSACAASGGSVGPSAQAHNTGTQSVSNSGGTATLTFNTNDWDTGSIHSTVTNPTRFTAPSTGYYMVGCHVQQNASNTGNVYLVVRVNGSTSTQVTYNSAGFQDLMVGGWILHLTSGDYVEYVVTNFTTGTWSTGAGATAQLTKLSTSF